MKCKQYNIRTKTPAARVRILGQSLFRGVRDFTHVDTSKRLDLSVDTCKHTKRSFVRDESRINTSRKEK